MTIKTRWDRDGSLIVTCGKDELVVTAVGFVSRNVTARKKTSSSSKGGSGQNLFLRTITPGKPGFVCNIMEQTPKINFPTVRTFEELKGLVTKIDAASLKNEVMMIWDSDEAIPFGPVNKMIETELSRPLDIMLFPPSVRRLPK